MIKRQKPLETLRKFKDKRLIKVVTGSRRCGKSTLLEMFRQEVLEQNPGANIVTLDFEREEDRNVATSGKLYARVAASLDPKRRNYVFLDEIQHVEHFEEAVDALFARKDADLYVTGSNSGLL